MRAFIALQLPTRFLDETAGLSRCLSAQIKGRYMPRQNLHITLAFLGDIDESQAQNAVTALDCVSGLFASIPLQSDGLGKFGRKNDATLWMGIGPKDDLAALANAVRSELTNRGVPFDDKPFVGHITLARRAKVTEADFASLPFPNPDTASTITLFKSELSSEGATYKALYSVELKG